MATQTDSTLLSLAQEVKNETINKANTALRIGTLFENIIDSKLNKDKIIQVVGVTVLAASFALVGGFYEASISNANIVATSIVDVIPSNASNEIVSAAIFLPETDSSAGAVKVYCKNLPTGTITVTLNIINNG